MTFEEYLTKRRVSVAAFSAAEPQRFAEWQHWFGQMHPESFYTMVKMVLNDVRRNYWLAEVPKPAIVENAEATATAPARPAGRRAAISRPATSDSETPKPETQPIDIPTEVVKSALETPEAKTEEGTSAPKPARPVFKPRGVIKKPTAEENFPVSENPDADKTAENAAAELPTEIVKPETEKTATEIPEVPAAKPARPRAVIKRPSALSKPEAKTEETGEKTVGNSAEKVEEANSGTAETLSDPAEKPGTEKVAETPKPPRPRPVFKRPTAASTSEIAASETEKTVGETPQKPETSAGENALTESPVAIPGQEGASEAKAVSEEIQQSPEAAKAAEEIAAEAGHVPKPPRPRPVFKRPAAVSPPEIVAGTGETEAGVNQETEIDPIKNQPENPSETVGDSTEKVEEPAQKPPRQRPVFKRPNKPESDETGSS